MDNNTLINHLHSVLMKDSRFRTDDGQLIKNAIVEAALNLDATLISYLLSDELICRQFFITVNDVKVFDKVRFQRFVMNKSFLPDSYTAFKNKVGLTNADGEFLSESREVVLSWPYKDCVLEGGQTKEDAKRDEIFWNETLAPDEINRIFEPKALTNFRRYDQDGEHEVSSISKNDNFIIKGNNLLALHSLKKVYAGQVKLIYIDPPYNTGSDSFGYNDSFSHSTWLTFMKNRLEVARELLKDDGVICVHCDDNEQAYLKVILDSLFGRDNFINTIINQSANSVYGTKASAKEKTIIKTKDYILVYKRNNLTRITPLYTKSEKPIYDSHEFILEEERKYSIVDWFSTHYAAHFSRYKLRITKENVIKLLKFDDDFYNDVMPKLRNILYEAVSCSKKFDEQIEAKLQLGKIVEIDGVKYCREDEGKGQLRFLRSLQESCSWSDDHTPEFCKVDILGDVWNTSSGYQNINQEGNVTLKGGKKPEELLAKIIKMFTQPKDILVDFHLGSGTTAAVAHKMGRRYIGCEQIEAQIELIKTRLTNVVNGDQSGISKSVGWDPMHPTLMDGDKYANNSFVYCELANANQTFVDKIIAAEDTATLQNLWKQIQQTGFLSYKVQPKEIDKNVEDFTSLSFDNQKRFLIECLDMNLLYIPYGDMNDATFNLSENDKQLTNQFYSLK